MLNDLAILPRCVLDDVPSPAWRASKSIVAALSKRKSGNLSAVIARFLCLVFRWDPEKKMVSTTTTKRFSSRAWWLCLFLSRSEADKNHKTNKHTNKQTKNISLSLSLISLLFSYRVTRLELVVFSTKKYTGNIRKNHVVTNEEKKKTTREGETTLLKRKQSPPSFSTSFFFK